MNCMIPLSLTALTALTLPTDAPVHAVDPDPEPCRRYAELAHDLNLLGDADAPYTQPEQVFTALHLLRHPPRNLACVYTPTYTMSRRLIRTATSGANHWARAQARTAVIDGMRRAFKTQPHTPALMFAQCRLVELLDQLGWATIAGADRQLLEGWSAGWGPGEEQRHLWLPVMRSWLKHAEASAPGRIDEARHVTQLWVTPCVPSDSSRCCSVSELVAPPRARPAATSWSPTLGSPRTPPSCP